MNPRLYLALAFVPALLAAAFCLFVVPRFAAVFESFGAELPFLTSLWLRGYQWLALVPFAFLVVWAAMPDSPMRGFRTLMTSAVLSTLLFASGLYALYAPIFRLAATI